MTALNLMFTEQQIADTKAMLTDRVITVHGQSAMAKSDEWQTDPDFFAKLNAVYQFTLDAAATTANAQCHLYLTKKQDGLLLPWGKHRVWVNPPYSRGELMKWTNKGLDEGGRGALVCMLVPASTDTKWWQQNVWSPPESRVGVPFGIWTTEHNGMRMLVQEYSMVRISIHFVPHRLRFMFDGKFLDGSMKPNALVVYEPPRGYLAAWS